MTDHIVVGDRVAVTVGFRTARARLRILALDGMLLRASEVAYGVGVTGLAELAGPAAGLTRLADVCLEDLAETDDCAQIAVQWEAIAADGKLFTALDADLMLVPTGDQVTAVSLTGAYRPQPWRAGAGPDQVIVRCCATAAIGSFLDQVACALVHPAGTGGHAGRRTLRLPPMASQNRWLDRYRQVLVAVVAVTVAAASGSPVAVFAAVLSRRPGVRMYVHSRLRSPPTRAHD